MKKEKSIIVISIIFALLLNLVSSVVLAETDTRPHEDPDENVDFAGIYAIRSNKYEFSPQQLLNIYAWNSSTPTTSEYLYNKVLKYRQNLNEGTLIPIHPYTDATTGVELETGEDTFDGEFAVDSWNDGVIDASDASAFLALSVGGEPSTVAEKRNQQYVWEAFIKILKYALADELEISRDDVVVYVDVNMAEISEFNIAANGFTTNSEDKYTDAVMAKMLELETANQTINNNINNNNNWAHQIVKIRATTVDNGDWSVVLGTDNNFYFLQDEAATAEFDTDLKYSVSVTDAEGTLKNGTFIPPYIDNDIDKKDADVTATISSKTNEGISVTNDVIVKTDRTANTEGWYYSSEDNIKSIDKKYLFDDYDNTTYNGIVSETVKIVGNEDGRDTQNVSIKWKFRRKSVKEKENDDKSVTITIEYNLPVDKDSIPDGWTPVYDADGKTVHAIKTTIKKGEDYDKDVIVKQNGTDEKVTTKVTKTWEKEGPSVLPQTGAFTVVLSIAILGIVVFAVTRYRKLKK